jgi:hypothetical protein
MGIYIPGVELPKNCEECKTKLNLNIPGCTNTNVSSWGVMLNCPLKDIELIYCENCAKFFECGVGEYYQGGCTFGERKK